MGAILSKLFCCSRNKKPDADADITAPPVEPVDDHPEIQLGVPVTSQFNSAGGVSMATWNIRHLSTSRIGGDLKAIKIIAGIIQKFDVVAVQEIRDTEIIRTLLSHMDGWSATVSDVILFGKDHDQKEYYAFFYNAARITLISPARIIPCFSNVSLPVESGVQTRLRQRKQKNLQEAFSREPVAAYFRAFQMDFVLVTIHLIWGDGREDIRREVKVLDEMMIKVRNFTKNERDVILLGDFNLPYDSKYWELDSPEDTENWMPLVHRPCTSTFSPDNPSSKLYDQIWIPDSTQEVYTNKSGVIYFDKLFPNSHDGRKAARKRISDHRPVWAIFSDIDKDAGTENLNFSKLVVSGLPVHYL
eukprot:353190_1